MIQTLFTSNFKVEQNFVVIDFHDSMFMLSRLPYWMLAVNQPAFIQEKEEILRYLTQRLVALTVLGIPGRILSRF